MEPPWPPSAPSASVFFGSYFSKGLGCFSCQFSFTSSLFNYMTSLCREGFKKLLTFPWETFFSRGSLSQVLLLVVFKKCVLLLLLVYIFKFQLQSLSKGLVKLFFVKFARIFSFSFSTSQCFKMEKSSILKFTLGWLLDYLKRLKLVFFKKVSSH